MGEYSNLDVIEDLLDQFGESIDFTRPGQDASVGEDLLDNQALRIIDRAQNQTGTDGKWADNKGRYGERKRAEGLPVGYGLKGSSIEQMLNLVNVRGVQDITADEATMSFGVNDDAKDKGHWFTNGSEGEKPFRSGAKNQPPRPFYGITPEDADAIMEETAQAVGEWITNI